MPFYYTIVLPRQICAVVSNSYATFYAIWNLIFWSWIPTICMLVFGLLTVRHIRQGKRRVLPQNHFQRKQKRDRQLIQMLLVQSFLFGSTTTALSIGQLYVSITNNFMIKTNLEIVKENYLITILNYVVSVGPCISFYLFTLSSQLFRRELMNLFHWRPIIQVVSNTNTAIIPRAVN